MRCPMLYRSLLYSGNRFRWPVALVMASVWALVGWACQSVGVACLSLLACQSVGVAWVCWLVLVGWVCWLVSVGWVCWSVLVGRVLAYSLARRPVEM